MNQKADQFIPIELVFNPNWWYQTVGISFEESFYFDPATRITNDVRMRRVLYERFGEIGLGKQILNPGRLSVRNMWLADLLSLHYWEPRFLL